LIRDKAGPKLADSMLKVLSIKQSNFLLTTL
jgi:hypothetical protein